MLRNILRNITYVPAVALLARNSAPEDHDARTTLRNIMYIPAIALLAVATAHCTALEDHDARTTLRNILRNTTYVVPAVALLARNSAPHRTHGHCHPGTITFLYNKANVSGMWPML